MIITDRSDLPLSQSVHFNNCCVVCAVLCYAHMTQTCQSIHVRNFRFFFSFLPFNEQERHHTHTFVQTNKRERNNNYASFFFSLFIFISSSHLHRQSGFVSRMYRMWGEGARGDAQRQRPKSREIFKLHLNDSFRYSPQSLNGFSADSNKLLRDRNDQWGGEEVMVVCGGGHAHKFFSTPRIFLIMDFDIVS